MEVTFGMRSIMVGALAAITFITAAPTFAGTPAVRPAADAVQVGVIPPDPPVNHLTDNVIFAGSSGFLSYTNQGVDQFFWTTYGTKTTTQVTDLSGVPRFSVAGPDSIGLARSIGPGAAPGDVSILNLATMSWTHYAVPSSYSPEIVHGNQVVAGIAGSQPVAFVVLTFTGYSTFAVTNVTGMPSGYYGSALWVSASAPALLIPTTWGGVALLNLDTGVAGLIQVPAGYVATREVLTANQVGLYSSALQQVLVYSLGGLLDGSNTGYQVVNLPASASRYSINLINGAVLATVANCLGAPVEPLLAVPDSGGTPAAVLPESQQCALTEGTDGSAMALGGTGTGDWGVQRVTGDGNGGANASRVLWLDGPTGNAGLTISQGLVRHVETTPAVLWYTPRPLLFNHLLVPAGTSADDIQSLAGNIPPSALPCAAGLQCYRVADGRWGSSILIKGIALQLPNLEPIWLSSTSGSIVDASIQYEIIDGTGPSRQYLVEPGQVQPVIQSGPVEGAGLWFFTKWHADGPGRLIAKNIATGAVSGPVSTGSSCVASDVQVDARWVYWSCGASGPAGVYDRRTGRRLRVPAGLSLLGDGYLVEAQSAAGAMIWAVDKYSGDIAYVDAHNAVHIVDPDVPRTRVMNESPHSRGSQTISFNPPRYFAAWLVPSRPLISWTVQIRRRATGRLIWRASGGPVRLMDVVEWSGRLANGQKAPSGWYTWTALATTPGSTTPVQIADGTIQVK